MYLRTLGELALEGHAFRRPKPLLISAYLALEGPVTRRRLAELFWMSAADARDSLSTTLRRLSRLDADLVESDGAEVRVRLACDAVEFLAALSAGHPERALELYRGPFLAGLDLRLQEEGEEWVYGTRERLAGLARDAHLQLAMQAEDRGDGAAAARHAERALEVQHGAPWQRHRLAAVTQLLRGGSAARAWRVEQAVADEGPPAEHGPEAPPPLPTVATSFVGRQHELDAILAALATDHVRLLTLHGPGGAGKSRLALEAASRCGARGVAPDGAYFVPLETVTTPEAVAEAVAYAMRLAVPPHGSPHQHVINSIGERRVLVVLDNFEHLVGRTDLPAAILRACPRARLLVTSRVALNLHEEHVLGVEGLPSGDVGDVGGGPDAGDALVLLFDRMRQHDALARLSADDRLAAPRLCRAVDGSPLAIEMAAALTRVMPLHDIAGELAHGIDALVNRDPTSPARHRSLTAALDVSWTLLSPHDAGALARLSAFRGGFRRAAAAAVAGVDVGTLSRLVDASLVRALPDGRYERHPIVGQYAEAKLDADPDAAAKVRNSHARCYLAPLASPRLEILGEEALRTAEWIEEEFANVRAAWDTYLGGGGLDGIAEVAYTLVHFAEMRGRFGDVAALYRGALEVIGEREDEQARLARGSALGCLAFLAFRLGRYEEALAVGEASLQSLAAVSHRSAVWGTWAARQGMSLTAMSLGRAGEATAVMHHNIELCRRELEHEGDGPRRRALEVMAGTSFETLAVVADQEGRYAEALEHVREAMPLLRPHGAYGLGYVYWTTGKAQLALGAIEPAKAAIEEGLRFVHDSGFGNLLGYLVAELGRVHLLLGDTERSDASFRRALDIAIASGDTWLEANVRSAYGTAALATGRLEDARRRLLAAIAVARRHACFPFAMEALQGLAELAARDGMVAPAVRWLAFVRGSPYAAGSLASAAAGRLEELRSRLEAAAFAEATACGAGMDAATAFAQVAAGARPPVEAAP